MKKEKIMKIIALAIFSAYLVMLLRLAVFRDDFLSYKLFAHGHLNPVPVVCYLKLLKAHQYLFAVYQFGGNIAWFVPFGFLLPLMTGRPKKYVMIILFGFLLSLVIELSQFVFGTGETEVDDLLLNTAGTFIGFWLFKRTRHVLK